MATAQLPQTTDLATQASNWLSLLGGTKTTSNAGDISGLQSTMAGLQGQDYEAMLQAIFNKAGGQIPGLQQALGNAIGARSGGNSAVQAALSKLLSQTSTNAMDQVAKLQAQNYQTQGQVAGKIADTTAGTVKKTGTDVTGGLTQAAKILALLQGAQKLGLGDVVKGLTSDVAPATGMTDMTGFSDNFSAPVTSYTPSAAATAGTGNMFSSVLPDFAQGFAAPVASIANQVSSSYAPQATTPDWSNQNLLDIGIDPGSVSDSPAMQEDPLAFLDFSQPTAPVDTFEQDWFDATDYADGGVVRHPQGKAQDFADGGTVRAGGSRRSANPSVAPVAPMQQFAQGAAEELKGQFGNTDTGLLGDATGTSLGNATGADMANRLSSAKGLTSANPDLTMFTGGNNGNGGSSIGMNSGAGIDAGTFGNAVSKLGAVNSISGLTGGSTLPGGTMGVLGLASGLAKSKSPEDALGKVGTFAANQAVPGLGSLIGFGMNPSITNGVNALASMNPVGALWGGMSALTGMISPGEVATNAVELANPNQMMTPQMQANLEAEQALAAAAAQQAEQQAQAAAAEAASIAANNPNSAGLTGQANAMPGDALDNLMGLTGAFGTSSGSGFGGNTDHGSFGGSVGNSTNSGGTDTGSDNSSYQHGGPINGAGTGTSDSIKANLSDGEFVMSADVVDTLGEDFFNQLQAAFHTPAAMQRRTA